MSKTVCPKHQINHGGRGCSQCEKNAQDRPYRGMSRSVIVQSGVIFPKPVREDAKEGALVGIKQR